MSYIIKKTNGETLIALEDGTLDTTSSSITLIGKNYPGYGTIINDNMIKMLENFANLSKPANPLIGQLWYDTSSSKLKFYSGGENFKSLGSINVSLSTAPPSQNTIGDFWYVPDVGELRLFDGISYFTVGPPTNQSVGTFKNANIEETAQIGTDLFVGGNAFIGGDISAGSFSFSSAVPDNRVLFTLDSEISYDENFTYNPSIGGLNVNDITSSSATIGAVFANFLKLSQGSTSSPSLSFTSDTQTGILGPAVGNLVVATSGVERARFNSSGLLVVGTVSATTLSQGGNPIISSVAVSGGTTGLVTTGSPITTGAGTITLSGTLNVSNGGTGLTAAPAAGQLLIGNGSGYTLSTLTAGTGISIVNSGGSITITNTGGGGGGGGSVNSVGASTPLVSSGGTDPVISLSTMPGINSSYGGPGLAISVLNLDTWGRVSGATTATLPPPYTPAPPVLFNVTAGYTNGGRVIVKSTEPTTADLPGGAGTFQPGDIWFDPSAATGFTELKAQKGWTRLPNGIYFQWGREIAPANNSATFSFPVAFPTACFSIVASSSEGQPTAGNGNEVGASIVSNSQFRIFGDSDQARLAFWFAVGH